MGKFERISITKIKEEKRFRQDYGDVKFLAGVIEKGGFLSPIAVCELSNGSYLLAAGKRRLEACKLLGWTEIDAIVYEEQTPGRGA